MKSMKWVRKRHQVVMSILRIVMWFICKIQYKFKYKRLDQKVPHLILYNHQTVWDQFFVGLICNNKTYYVISDDMYSVKFVSPLLKWLLHPIPYKKASTDFTILKNCRKVISEGGSICISPEGNRTYSGKTEYINPTIVKMIKFLKVPVAVVNILGGYGAFPRWANKSRRGPVSGSVIKVYQYDDYKDLSDDELFSLIKQDLYVDETKIYGVYKSRHNAEYLERVIYNCPNCGFTNFYSKKDLFSCTTCNLKLKYTNIKTFVGVNCAAPFDNVKDWYLYQQDYLMKLNLLSMEEDKIIFSDVVKYSQVILRKKKNVISKEAKLKMYFNRIEVEYLDHLDVFLFDDIGSSGVFGKNKLNIFVDEGIYQFKGDKRFNAMKYVNLYYKYRIEKGTNKDDLFLGL